MYKAAIFPYDNYFFPFVKYKEEAENIKIVKVLSLKGWGTIGKSALSVGRAFHQDELMIEDGLAEIDCDGFDTLWIIDSEYGVEEELLFYCIERMARKGKNIFVSRSIDENQLSEIRGICDTYRVGFQHHEKKDKFLIDDTEIIYDINTPMIGIAGIDEKTNKIELQMEIKRRLEKDGYQVCWIASRKEAAYFGGEEFPGFMFQDHLPEKKKIIMYNHLMKWIEQERKPDVFLLGIPGGIMPVTKKQVGYFGISAFEIFNAVCFDFLVMSLYYGEANEKYLSELCRLMKYKFNSDVDCFNMSNVNQDVFSLDKQTPIEYIPCSDEQVQKTVDLLTYKERPVFHRNTYDDMYQFMMERLNEYHEMEVL